MSKSAKKHSEEHFTESRDFWWNNDYLTLLSDRLKLNTVRSALDIGCGVGHWTKTIAGLLSPAASITGIDNEPAWIKHCQKDVTHKYGIKAHFEVASAYSLPFDDRSFDLVTCQTLLMHLKKPQDAIQEMIRVLQPNGILLCIEPENLFAMLASSSTLNNIPPERFSKYFEFWARFESGKRNLGLGNNSVARDMPLLLSKNGVKNIEVHLCDRTTPLYPPYADKGQHILIEEFRQWMATNTGIWDKNLLRKYYLASGGSKDSFKIDYDNAHTLQKQMLQEIDRGEFSSAGGGLLYIFSGRK